MSLAEAVNEDLEIRETLSYLINNKPRKRASTHISMIPTLERLLTYLGEQYWFLREVKADTTKGTNDLWITYLYGNFVDTSKVEVPSGDDEEGEVEEEVRKRLLARTDPLLTKDASERQALFSAVGALLPEEMDKFFKSYPQQNLAYKNCKRYDPEEKLYRYRRGHWPLMEQALFILERQHEEELSRRKETTGSVGKLSWVIEPSSSGAEGGSSGALVRVRDQRGTINISSRASPITAAVYKVLCDTADALTLDVSVVDDMWQEYRAACTTLPQRNAPREYVELFMGLFFADCEPDGTAKPISPVIVEESMGPGAGWSITLQLPLVRGKVNLGKAVGMRKKDSIRDVYHIVGKECFGFVFGPMSTDANAPHLASVAKTILSIQGASDAWDWFDVRSTSSPSVASPSPLPAAAAAVAVPAAPSLLVPPQPLPPGVGVFAPPQPPPAIYQQFSPAPPVAPAMMMMTASTDRSKAAVAAPPSIDSYNNNNNNISASIASSSSMSPPPPMAVPLVPVAMTTTRPPQSTPSTHSVGSREVSTTPLAIPVPWSQHLAPRAPPPMPTGDDATDVLYLPLYTDPQPQQQQLLPQPLPPHNNNNNNGGGGVFDAPLMHPTPQQSQPLEPGRYQDSATEAFLVRDALQSVIDHLSKRGIDSLCHRWEHKIYTLSHAQRGGFGVSGGGESSSPLLKGEPNIIHEWTVELFPEGYSTDPARATGYAVTSKLAVTQAAMRLQENFMEMWSK